MLKTVRNIPVRKYNRAVPNKGYHKIKLYANYNEVVKVNIISKLHKRNHNNNYMIYHIICQAIYDILFLFLRLFYIIL